ncbi:hypothetical protein KY312_04005 [Candidatus Woesearchaeota archaeon]|nr:hypothetical protein [Candidatus Woesearchaeota archaeon]
MSGNNGSQAGAPVSATVAEKEERTEAEEQAKRKDISDKIGTGKQRFKNALDLVQNLHDRRKELSQRFTNMNEGKNPYQTVDSSVQEIFEEQHKQLKQVLANEAEDEIAKRNVLLRERAEQSVPYRVKKWLAKQLGKPDPEVEFVRTDEKAVIDYVIENNLKQQENTVKELESTLTTHLDEVDSSQEEIDNYVRLQFDNVDFIEDAEVRLRELYAEIDNLKEDRKDLKRKRNSLNYDGTAEGKWKEITDNLKTYEDEKRQLEKDVEKTTSEMESVNIEVHVKGNTYMVQQGAARKTKEQYEKSKAVFQTLNLYKRMNAQGSISRTFELIGEGAKQAGIGGKIVDVLEGTHAKLINTLNNGHASAGYMPALNPKLEQALKKDQNESKIKVNENLEYWKSLRDNS